MSPIILCVAAAMSVFSLPAGKTVVYALQNPSNYQLRVQLLDTSLLRDWVFVGLPVPPLFGRPASIYPLGWVPYASLATCPRWVLQVADTRGWTQGASYTSQAECEAAAEATAHGGSYCALSRP